MTRRLTAILCYDVVGYSLAMGRDEARTLEGLKSDRREIIDAKVDQHGGRTIKLLGDGALLEFASAVDAVIFAVEMQCILADRNTRLPEDQRRYYRIGINVGDVVIDGDDIYGDGVNIASRLETLAEPGGICIHQNVRDQLRGKLDIDFQDLGEVEAKNIEHPVRAFSVALNEKAAAIAARPNEKPRGQKSPSASGRRQWSFRWRSFWSPESLGGNRGRPSSSPWPRKPWRNPFPRNPRSQCLQSTISALAQTLVISATQSAKGSLPIYHGSLDCLSSCPELQLQVPRNSNRRARYRP